MRSWCWSPRLVLIPLVATVLGGFKTLGDLRVNPFGLPAEWQWVQLLGRSWSGSALLAAAGQFAGHRRADRRPDAGGRLGHGRLRLRARQASSARASCCNYLLLGLMFPAATAILPLFIKIRDLGLLDTYWGVVLPQVAFGLAASILLFRNFFRQLPGRAVRGGADRRLRLHSLLLVRHAAAVAADPGDRRRDRLRAQLEQTISCRWWCSTATRSTRGRSASWPTRASTRRTGSWCSPSSR